MMRKIGFLGCVIGCLLSNMGMAIETESVEEKAFRNSIILHKIDSYLPRAIDHLNLRDTNRAAYRNLPPLIQKWVIYHPPVTRYMKDTLDGFFKIIDSEGQTSKNAPVKYALKHTNSLNCIGQTSFLNESTSIEFLDWSDLEEDIKKACKAGQLPANFLSRLIFIDAGHTNVQGLSHLQFLLPQCPSLRRIKRHLFWEYSLGYSPYRLSKMSSLVDTSSKMDYWTVDSITLSEAFQDKLIYRFRGIGEEGLSFVEWAQKIQKKDSAFFSRIAQVDDIKIETTQDNKVIQPFLLRLKNLYSAKISVRLTDNHPKARDHFLHDLPENSKIQYHFSYSPAQTLSFRNIGIAIGVRTILGGMAIVEKVREVFQDPEAHSARDPSL